VTAVDTDGYWAALRGRLLPLDRDPPMAPANLDALERYWGGVRPLRPAAVLVGLVERREGVHVILTRRHDGMTQHAGQISFPGGRIDPDDIDAVDAALRETREEIGVAASMIVPLGRVEPLATVSGYIVQPVVARIDPDYELHLQASEVSAAFELPLARAARADLWQPYPVTRPGLAITMKALDFQGHTIWGATAMIIERLLGRLEGLAL
jgi:8-oxo-dGTP pyrophosphatase MutT (NUDIX family)